MSEALSRSRFPLLLLSLVLLVGGSRFDALRPIEGQVLAFGIPLGAVVSGVHPFWNAHAGLRNVVLTLGAVVLALALIGVDGVVLRGSSGHAPGVLVGGVLAFSLLSAVLLEVEGARQHVRSRLGAWFGLACGFALFFPCFAQPKDLFGSVFAAFVLGLFAGGGAGLLLGEFLVRRARR